MEEKGKYLRWILILVSLVCFSLAGLMIHSFSGKWKSDSPTTVAGPALNLTEAKLKKITSVDPPVIDVSESTWVLYVTGEVASPGIYNLPSGVRAYQLVDAAGGLTRNADGVSVNLAAPLSDGDHFHVPSKQFKPVAARTSETMQTSSGGGIVVSSLPAPVQKSSGSNKNVLSGGLININVASAQELQRLPGIGSKTADKIVSYREKVGSFRTKEELMKVRGIGSKKLDAIVDMITTR